VIDVACSQGISSRSVDDLVTVTRMSGILTSQVSQLPFAA
jgi:hypothetical protein